MALLDPKNRQAAPDFWHTGPRRSVYPIACFVQWKRETKKQVIFYSNGEIKEETYFRRADLSVPYYPEHRAKKHIGHAQYGTYQQLLTGEGYKPIDPTLVNETEVARYRRAIPPDMPRIQYWYSEYSFRASGEWLKRTIKKYKYKNMVYGVQWTSQGCIDTRIFPQRYADLESQGYRRISRKEINKGFTKGYSIF